jgi:hypothetical protein
MSNVLDDKEAGPGPLQANANSMMPSWKTIFTRQAWNMKFYKYLNHFIYL